MTNVNEEIKNRTIEQIEKYIDAVYTLRKNSLTTEGEYSIGNLVFKTLRSKGYLDNLKDLRNQLIGKELSLESLEEDTEKVKDHKWVNRGKDGTHGEFKTKKAADSQRRAMFANGYHEELGERLDDRKRRDYYEEISRIAFNQAIIQDNGLFNIYNIKEDDVDRIVNRLRNLDYIEWVNKAAGRYDFSKVVMFNQPQPRYYTIAGKIKEN